jgi:hypothetical protein
MFPAQIRESSPSYKSALAWHPGKLWSLWDMVTVSAEKYVTLGELIQQVRISFVLRESPGIHDDDDARIGELRDTLKHLIQSCEELGLSRAQELVSHSYDDLPQSTREWELLLRAIMTDIKKTVFLFIPDHLAKFYEIIFPSIVTTAFPLASKELVWAGNALAVGSYTASVFHSMRAAEIGVRVLGKELCVEFPDKPLELAEWANILDQADSIIVKMKEKPRGTHKDEELTFYSQAAVQFRYFKDAWRVRVAHARETYEETPAIRVFNHTHEFFETLSTRLKEPKPSV